MNRLIEKIIVMSLTFLISGMGFPVSLVFALPEGGAIVGGQGTINQPTAQDLTVNQNTSNLIINWQGFDIGAAESVQFFQPGTDSVALNRVTGTDPSRIAGRLSANGQVFITNPSGVIFLPGSQVNVHGLLATTLSISDQDFLDRNYRFFQDPGRSLASIINEGTINARYTGFLAPSVVNRGTIVANLGSVALASGKTATLDFIGDDLINFAITEEVEGTATDSDGNVLDHNISNEGIIRATGGAVSLSVRRAGEIVKSVINQEGIIEAQSVVNREGKIFLSGGDNGIVSVTGTLDASGKGAGEKGGTIHVTGENVGLFETAKLDASGDAGGGEILIGGDRQGEGELQNAKATFVDENVSVNVDAINQGDGGKLIVFVEETARIYGNLSARGGAVSGNGGFVETSGKQFFELSKTPDIGAPNGQGGEWLIDPFSITVVAGAVATAINSASPFVSTVLSSGTSQLGVGLILTALLSGDVSITTGGGSLFGEIIWSADLDFNGIGTRTLSLFSEDDIIFNNSIQDSVSGGDVLNLNFSADNDNGTAGSLIFASGVNIATGGGFLNMKGADIDLAGFLNSGTGKTTYSVNNTRFSSVNSIGVGDATTCGGSSCDARLDNTELSHITAGDLQIGTNEENITIENVTAADRANISGDITFSATTVTGSIPASATTEIPQQTVQIEQGTEAVNNFLDDFTETGNDPSSNVPPSPDC